MLTELHGKGGRVCGPAREGTLHCPLIVRPTSEDVVTGHLALALKVLNPRWWVPDLLNAALGTNRFQRQVFRRFRVEPWHNHRAYPRELLPWDEGSTQVDLTLAWENPPTTVFIEAKYGSELTKQTSGDDGTSGYPSDQLIRNVRVGLLACGWFQRGDLFPMQPRDFAVIVLSPTLGHRLVSEYRDEARLRAAIPHGEQLMGLPRGPLVGELDYTTIIAVLHRQFSRFTRAERVLAQQLNDYLALKRKAFSTRNGPRQARLVETGTEEVPSVSKGLLDESQR